MSAMRRGRCPEGDFFAFLTAAPNLPFAVALALMLLLAGFEVFGLVFGASISHWLDGLHHGPDIDLHHGIDADHGSIADSLLGWFHVGRVPVLALLVIFLTAFGTIGLTLQALADSVVGHLVPMLPASAAALPLALLGVRGAGGAIARILPRDETTAISQDALVGRSAVIVLGEARRNSPAQARATDRHGQVHYFMVEPAEVDDCLVAGEPLFLVSRVGATYRATRPLHPSLN